MNQPPSDPSSPFGPPPGGGPFGPPPGGGPFGPPPGGGFGGPPPGGFGGPPPGGFGGPPGHSPFSPPGGGFYGPQGFRPLVPPPPASSGSPAIVVGVIAGVLALCAVIAGVVFFAARPKPSAITAPASDDSPFAAGAYDDEGPWSDSDASVPVSSRDPMWGARAAPVTIVVFEDFQCPFCSRFESTLAQVKAKYGPKSVRVVWKSYPLPFHTEARPAAIAAQAVFQLGGSRAFWKFHDSAFANQRELNQTSFERWAAEAGVDVASFRSLQEDPAVAAKVDADAALAKSSGVSGTPNTFINGFLLSGAQPIEKVTSLVDTELSSAQRAIAAGTPADRVYSKLSQENKVRNPPPKAADPPEDENKVWSVPVGKSPSRGPETAKVTIVEFADFQCPFCARAEATLAQVSEIYGSKVRIVWKDNPLPFHQNAEPAAELALEARAQKGDAAFWAAHDLLFKNQQALSAADLDAYALQLHLDVARVRSAIATHKHNAAIEEDKRLANQVTAKGTPTFFINGHKLAGAQSLEKFKSIIDRELAR
jgi:protein-disulfide isomerase